MKKAVFIFSLLILTATIHAQQFQYKTSETYKFPLQSTVNLNHISESYLFVLQNLEMPSPGGSSYKSYLRKLKTEMPEKLRGTSVHSPSRSSIDAPHVLTDFEGNKFHGHVPNDNDLAISNDGKIVSVTNSVIYFYNKDSMLRTAITLEDFVDSFPQKESKYDPKVLYDPDEDRFILCFLNGSADSNSYIFMAFSKTNDPTGEWNIYTIPGNPLVDSSWSDFPMFAITKDELFFTINLLRNRQTGESWKTTFKQTIIWQIDKQSGYQGKALSSVFYHDIEYDGLRLRNLCPVKAGNDINSPNMYFLSNKNFSIETDSFFIVEITGKAGETNTEIKVDMSASDINYGVPPMASQPYNRLLETNDARVLDAYIENDKIQFVGNTVNFNNNFASIYFGEITNLSTTKDISLKIIDSDSMEYGYPSIVYTGKNGSDEAIVLVNHTSEDVYPGVSTFFYKDGSFSDIRRIKEGEVRVTVQSTTEQRWGDYTGIQRKYNEDGVVWCNGYYGKKRPNDYPSLVNGTWIFELVSPTYSSIKSKQEKETTVEIFPNPTSNLFYIEFNNPVTQMVRFQLLSINGQIVKDFGNINLKSGQNALSFNLNILPEGTYILMAKSANSMVFSTKVVKN